MKSYVSLEGFLECLERHCEPSNPISQVLHTPNSPTYCTVLKSYIRNLRFDEPTTPKPLLILTPTHVSHIQAAIISAKIHGLQMKIRSGGHDYEGVSYVSDSPFFVLDMFNFRSISVSIEDETAWVQTGATLGEVFYRIAEKSNVHGFPAGVCPTVGVGGHFGGGGYGNLMRMYGLSIDNIIDAQMVDANGRILDRSSMGEDLFWAITGGGGSSFGVVLAYKIKLVRVTSTVTVFQVARTYDENLTDIVYHYQQVAHKLPKVLFIRMSLGVVKSTYRTGEKTNRATFYCLFLGNSETLLAITNENFPQLGLKKSDCIEMSWAESILFWTQFPVGTPVDALLSRVPQVLTHLKRKSDYITNPMPKEGLEIIFKKMRELESVILTFNPCGGRMAEIPSSEKPFPHRAGNLFKLQYATNWEENGVEAAEKYIDKTRILYAHMTPFVSKSPRASFLNYRDLDLGINKNGRNSYMEAAGYGIKYFKNNFERLVKIKTRVDPDNFFRNEQSIPLLPSTSCFSYPIGDALMIPTLLVYYINSYDAKVTGACG